MYRWFKRFVKQTGGTELPVEISSLIGGMNTTRDLLWLAGEILPREVIVKFACKCALISLPLIEGYTDKYEVIAEFLKDLISQALLLMMLMLGSLLNSILKTYLLHLPKADNYVNQKSKQGGSASQSFN